MAGPPRTFTSAHTPETQTVAWRLSVVRLHPKLSLTRTAKAGARITVPLFLQGPAAAEGRLKSLTVKVSYYGRSDLEAAPVHTGAGGKPYLTRTNPGSPVPSPSARPSPTPPATPGLAPRPVAAVPQILRTLTARGYHFVTVSHLRATL